MPAPLDLNGQRYGRLLVQHKLEERSGVGHVQWSCLCDCGNSTSATTGSLRSGNTTSCGCRSSELTTERNRENATHGLSKTPIYGIWNGMIQRCTNTMDHNYPRYGAQGIQVCDRWRTFENFYADMGDRPSDEHSIDRFPDQNGNYEPGNCRWATPEEQANNRTNNRYLEYRGQTYTAPQLARLHGLNLSMFEYRLAAGWSVEDAVNKPSRVDSNV